MMLSGGRAAVILTAAIFGLTYGLSAPLIALGLAEAGYSEAIIGFNAAMHALGVLLVAPVLPRLAWRFGSRRLALAALVCAAALLALFPVAPALWIWFPLRVALGTVSETLFVVSETWLNQLTDEGSRARTFAVYTASLSLGFALGPLILVAVGNDGALPFLAGSAVSLLAFAVTALAHAPAEAIEPPASAAPLRFLRLAPLAMVSTAMNAALEAAGLSLLALYAITLGWGETPATLLISTLMIGAIVLQLPIGWLGDRMDRRRLVWVLAVCSAVGALLWPLVIDAGWVAYPVLFVWGGAFVGIYTLTITIVGSRFSGGDLVGIYALMSVAWGLGALAGPTLAGLAMEATRHGLPLFAALCCGAFALYVARSRSAT